MDGTVWRLGSVVLVLAAISMACGQPPLFPKGGAIKASGYCEVSFDGPAAETGVKATPSPTPSPALMAQQLHEGTEGTEGTEGYGYELNGTGRVATIFFEDGALTHLKIVDTEPAEFEPEQIRRRPGVPAFSARGELPAPIIEGRWHEVPVETLSPPAQAGQRDAARIRFRGETLEIAFAGMVGQAECTWEREPTPGQSAR